MMLISTKSSITAEELFSRLKAEDELKLNRLRDMLHGIQLKVNAEITDRRRDKMGQSIETKYSSQSPRVVAPQNQFSRVCKTDQQRQHTKQPTCRSNRQALAGFEQCRPDSRLLGDDDDNTDDSDNDVDSDEERKVTRSSRRWNVNASTTTPDRAQPDPTPTRRAAGLTQRARTR